MIQTWTDRPPGRLDDKRVTLVQEGAAIPEAWLQAEQFLDVYEAVMVLWDRKAQLIDVLKEPSRYQVDVRHMLHSLRLPMFKPELVCLRRTKPCLDFLRRWRAELDQAPAGCEQVALTVAAYEAQLMTWYLPPWREYEKPR